MQDLRPTGIQATDIGYVALACCLIPDENGWYKGAGSVLRNLHPILAQGYGYGKNHPFKFYINRVLAVYKPGMVRREVSRRSGVSQGYVAKILRDYIKKAPADATARA